jgi:hypothetical protein
MLSNCPAAPIQSKGSALRARYTLLVFLPRCTALLDLLPELISQVALASEPPLVNRRLQHLGHLAICLGQASQRAARTTSIMLQVRLQNNLALLLQLALERPQVLFPQRQSQRTLKQASAILLFNVVHEVRN